MTGTERMYTIVQNPSDGGVSIYHPGTEVDDLYLGAYEAKIVDPEVWNDDVQGFWRFRESGRIVVRKSTSRPLPVPKPPGEDTMPELPLYMTAVRQIVFAAEDEAAESYINMVPHLGEEGGGEVDTVYLKGKLLPILRAAEDWLKRWHLDNRKKRLRIVRKRIREIEALP